jgi:hypothetical protein
VDGSEGSTAGWQTIKVDPEVWKAIHADATPFVDRTPNDVLRRRFLTGQPAPLSTPTAAASRRRGALRVGLDKATLVPGDILICEQPRKKRTFKAEVLADGWIKTIEPDVGEFQKVSPSLGACTGSAINGWDNWVVERTGEKLQAYRY